MITKEKSGKGITLVALVITIIVLLILAGITIGTLGKSGIIEKTKKAKVLSQLSTAKEEVILATSELLAERSGEKKDITPKLIAETVNKDNNRNVSADNESTFPANIVYPADSMGIGEKILIKIGENLEILEAKTESGITSGDDTTDGNKGDTSEDNKGNTTEVDVGKVKVEITNVTGQKFTINVIPENEENIAMYQYYLNGNLIYEGTEKQYTVKNLKQSTKYNVEVKAIPRTTVSVAKLTQSTADEPVIELANKFDKYIYINSSEGNDATGNGTKANPYKTLDKIADSGIIEKEYSYGIVLNNGNYELTSKLFTLNCNKSINLIGNKQNTILIVNGIFANTCGGTRDYSVNFYRLVWDGNNYKNDNTINVKNNMNFNNIVFRNTISTRYSYFCPDGQSSIIMKNCTLVTQTSNMLRTTNGTIKLTNCYGGFSSGFSTSDSNWNYQTNVITQKSEDIHVDSTTYQITDGESVWKNVGTGLNPDETTANIGVYGGTYSWEYGDDF